MKKIIKNPIFTFVLGGIFFSSISVYAVTTILSKDIKFMPENTNWKVENVEEAINDLYEYANSNLYDKLSFESQRNISYGDRLANRSTSINLETGNYLIFGVNTYVSSQPSFLSSISNSAPTINYTSGTCVKLNSYTVRITATQTTNNLYEGFMADDGVWNCSFDEDVTVSISENLGSSSVSNILPQAVRIYSVKLD